MVTLQFVCGSDLSSRAISWFSQGHLSHVDAVMPNGELLGARSDVIRGIPAGVQIRPPNYETVVRRVRMSLECTVASEKAFYKFLLGEIGKPYDKTAIVAFVFNRDWRAPDSWFCSELQMRGLERSGLCEPLYLDVNKITPVECAVVATAIGFKIAA